jgi:hypothetical protein
MIGTVPTLDENAGREIAADSVLQESEDAVARSRVLISLFSRTCAKQTLRVNR